MPIHKTTFKFKNERSRIDAYIQIANEYYEKGPIVLSKEMNIPVTSIMFGIARMRKLGVKIKKRHSSSQFSKNLLEEIKKKIPNLVE